MSKLEIVPTENQAIEIFGQPLPKEIDLVGELPKGMVFSTKQEVLGPWAGQIHTKALFLRQTQTGETQTKQSDDVYAIVLCRDTQQQTLMAVVVKTSLYNIRKETERLWSECDQIASEHYKDFQTYSNFLVNNDAFMLRTGKWFVNVYDRLSEPIDQIPVVA